MMMMPNKGQQGGGNGSTNGQNHHLPTDELDSGPPSVEGDSPATTEYIMAIKQEDGGGGSVSNLYNQQLIIAGSMAPPPQQQQNVTVQFHPPPNPPPQLHTPTQYYSGHPSEVGSNVIATTVSPSNHHPITAQQLPPPSTGTNNVLVKINKTEQSQHVYGRLSYKDDVLYICDHLIEIGRNSSTSSVHFHVGKNSFVSRKHLTIMHDNYQEQTVSQQATPGGPITTHTQCVGGEFYLVCLSKNGVFVDDSFQRRSSEPFKLPKTCTLRFPSTNIRILFESYIDEPFDAAKNSKTVENSNVIYSPLKISIPETERKSPFPSPTGTISAANSCPTSPRPGFQDYHSYNYNNNNNFQNDLFPPPSTSSQNDYEKPPYSYAQLIVQSISASAEKQLTLSGIYSFISKHYPYYRKEANKGWQNSIRHNLSLNRYFIKVARSQDEPGKGSFWRIDPTSEAKLIDQSYKKRRQRGSQCFRTPYGMPRSAPVSPSHMDNSSENSPLHDIVLQSAPGSPGGAAYHKNKNGNEEVCYSSSYGYGSYITSPNSSVTKRQLLHDSDDVYDEHDVGAAMSGEQEDSDEYEPAKRQKYSVDI